MSKAGLSGILGLLPGLGVLVWENPAVGNCKNGSKWGKNRSKEATLPPVAAEGVRCPACTSGIENHRRVNVKIPDG